MTLLLVETSGESAALARAEAIAASEALGGRAADPERSLVGLTPVEIPDRTDPRDLAGRLALARRCLVFRAPSDARETWLRTAGTSGESAAVRRLGRPSSGGGDPEVLAAGRAYKDGGGRIDLERPDLRFWLAADPGGRSVLLEELAAVDRPAIAARRMPRLPYQRPVALPPRLARAAANLARVRPGDRIVDPFVGTGALLAEAGLFGGRLYGIDRDPEMVRGALRNLAHLGVHAEELVVGDAGTSDFSDPDSPIDAVLTDPPYGRASSTGGEASAELVARVLPRWTDRIRPGGRRVVIAGGPVPAPGDGWREIARVPLRVHRSLTRTFYVHERGTG